MAVPAHPICTARFALVRAINRITSSNVEEATQAAQAALGHLDPETEIGTDVSTALDYLDEGDSTEASYHLRTAVQRIDARLEVGR